MTTEWICAIVCRVAIWNFLPLAPIPPLEADAERIGVFTAKDEAGEILRDLTIVALPERHRFPTLTSVPASARRFSAGPDGSVIVPLHELDASVLVPLSAGRTAARALGWAGKAVAGGGVEHCFAMRATRKVRVDCGHHDFDAYGAGYFTWRYAEFGSGLIPRSGVADVANPLGGAGELSSTDQLEALELPSWKIELTLRLGAAPQLIDVPANGDVLPITIDYGGIIGVELPQFAGRPPRGCELRLHTINSVRVRRAIGGRLGWFQGVALHDSQADLVVDIDLVGLSWSAEFHDFLELRGAKRVKEVRVRLDRMRDAGRVAVGDAGRDGEVLRIRFEGPIASDEGARVEHVEPERDVVTASAAATYLHLEPHEVELPIAEGRVDIGWVLPGDYRIVNATTSRRFTLTVAREGSPPSCVIEPERPTGSGDNGG